MKTMTPYELLEMCISDLGNIRVNVDQFDDVIVPIARVRANLAVLKTAFQTKPKENQEHPEEQEPEKE